MKELFPLVTEDGTIIGKATRQECHAGTFLLHPVVHLHVFNPDGDLYLQKRAMNKDIQPGKWDTSVGGHVDFGESVEQALLREAHEELGLEEIKPTFVFRYPFRTNVEFELVNTYYTVYSGVITPDPGEISEGRFWNKEEILESLGKGIFTPNFEQEVVQLLKLAE
jgi:isopentenyldiphosphate isomerase